jgi:hypothetical protein
MMKLAIILGVPVAMLATIASLGVVVVDVREGGPDGNRIVVPVPLVFAQAALALAPIAAPDHAMRVPEQALEHMDLAKEVLEALAAAPDGEYVRVEDHDELVVVAKEGRYFKVNVKNGTRENVSVNVPINLALQALPGRDGRIRTAALAGALSGVRFTDLVDVQDGKDHVRVWVW